MMIEIEKKNEELTTEKKDRIIHEGCGGEIVIQSVHAYDKYGDGDALEWEVILECLECHKEFPRDNFDKY